MSHEPLHQKYVVTRLHDETGKHDLCEFFVLDLGHDKHAQVALRAYAESVNAEDPGFAAELIGLADNCHHTDAEQAR